MDYLELKVIFEAADPELAADLIADVFYDLGLTGVVVETPEQDPEADWGADAVAPPAHHAVIGYIAVNDALEGRRRAVTEALARLEARVSVSAEMRQRTIGDQDWAESWKAFFHPERVGRHLVVKPTWRSYAARPGEIVIEIDPGMAFGTGTHPTTRLCLGLIEDYLHAGDTVVDVGTGSGILLVAAAKLGAGRLVGVDIDAVAVGIAAANLALNRIAADGFRLLRGTIDQVPPIACQMVVANILSEVIVPMIPDVVHLLAPGGVFIASGIVAKNAPVVVAALNAAGLTLVDERRMEDWVAMVAGACRLKNSKQRVLEMGAHQARRRD
jgi:ribosomal protein L11 methyltransferase